MASTRRNAKEDDYIRGRKNQGPGLQGGDAGEAHAEYQAKGIGDSKSERRPDARVRQEKKKVLKPHNGY